MESQVEDLADPIMSSIEESAEEDAIEIDEMEPSPLSKHSGEEEEEGEDNESLGNASDDDSINLFIDLATMGLDMDTNSCRDLLAYEN